MERNLVEDLLKECAKMQQFDHPNVLKLSGVCLDGGPAPYIILPFMSSGSLLSYLREERENLMVSNAAEERLVSGHKEVRRMSMNLPETVECGTLFLSSSPA